MQRSHTILASLMTITLALLVSSTPLAAQYNCTNKGPLGSYTGPCSCDVDIYYETYGCKLETGKCDPLASIKYCAEGDNGDSCYYALAALCSSDSVAATDAAQGHTSLHSDKRESQQAAVRPESKGSVPETIPHGHLCTDNSPLIAWLESKLPQRAAAFVKATTAVGG